MWFDVQQALNAIEGDATHSSARQPVLVVAPVAPLRVAVVADVASSPAQKREADPFRHGVSVAGHPLTWTGCVVSLADWRKLSDWDKHGPDKRHWNGITKKWEHPKGQRNEQ